MRKIVCLGLILTLISWSCTKQTRLGNVNFDELDGSGARTYSIEMSNGNTFVIKRFDVTADRIMVTEVESMPGTYDSDGKPDPRTPFWININEIVAVDEIVRDKVATVITVGLIVAGAAALLGMIALGRGLSGLD